MTDPRHTVRVLVFQSLCLLDAQGDEALPMLGRFLDEHAPDGKAAVKAEQLARTIWRQRGTLDERIAATAENWSVVRMQPVDRSIIRLGTYEILRVEDVPAAVAIDEAVEIAKEFGGQESPGFVNGILDGLLQPGGSGKDAAEPTERND